MSKFLKTIVPLVLIVTLAFSSRLAVPLALRWIILILIGEIALLLLGFDWKEIANAFRWVIGRREAADTSERSIYFWEAAARNAIHLGVLGTLAGFVIQICSQNGGMAGFILALGNALLSTIYGLFLAAILSAPVVQSLWAREATPEAKITDSISSLPTGADNTSPWKCLPVYFLFLVLILGFLLTFSVKGSKAPFDWFVHWPAWLAVFGGALILGIMFGGAFKNGSMVLGFACSGLIGSLLGVVQALQGFSQVSILMVSEGITFMISSCFAGHIGLLTFGMPIQDRNPHPRIMTLCRLVWYGYPVATLLWVAMAALMVTTPMHIEKP